MTGDNPSTRTGATPPTVVTADHIAPEPITQAASAQETGTGPAPEGCAVVTVVTPTAPANIAGHGVAVPGYEILGELGRGGMGVVFKARQQSLNRIVALKMVLAIGRATAGELHRFLGEAEALAAIRHPHVVQVFECGQNPEGAFLTMEHLPGGNLADRLRKAPRFTPKEAAALVEKIARGVQAVHAAGIVHRDLKPGNVLFDEAGEPKVTDFGLAKRGTGSDLTATGAVMGTPAYMAPEQARGEGKLAGPAADVWALGVMLYECLSGKRPFDAPESWALMRKVIADDPTPLRSRVSNIPRDLEVVCMKCLSKESYRRYPSAGAVADDLQRFLAGEPVTARPVSRARRAYLWFRKRPVAAVGLFALVLVVGVAAVLIEQNTRNIHTTRVAAMVDQLRTAPPSEVSAAIRSLEPYRDEVVLQLREVMADSGADSRARLNAAIFLASRDPAAVDFLLTRLPEIRPADLRPVVGALMPAARQESERFWAVVRNADEEFGTRVRHAAILAEADAGNPQWNVVAPDLASRLVSTASPGEAGTWAGLLVPIRDHLRGPLQQAMADDLEGDQGYVATGLLATLFRDDPIALSAFLERASFRQSGLLIPALASSSREAFPADRFLAHADRSNGWNTARDMFPRRNGLPIDPEMLAEEVAEGRARAALALIAAGQGNRVWHLFGNGPDPRVRTSLIHHAAAAGIDPALLVAQLGVDHAASIRQGLLLTLGEYRPARLPPKLVESTSDRIRKLYEVAADPGVHSACAWVLRQWGRAGTLADIDRRLTTPGPAAGRDWFIAPSGTTFAIVRGPVELIAGSPPSEWHRDWSPSRSEDITRWLIPRDYAIATTEVTVAQFQKMIDGLMRHWPTDPKPVGAVVGAVIVPVVEGYRDTILEFRGEASRYFPAPDCPVGYVRHRLAMCYCRWLGEIEGIPEEEQCYPPIFEIIHSPGSARANFLERTGYRLPTEAEWEAAARAGTRTRYHHGSDDRLLSQYAWYQPNTLDRTELVGRLKPNAWGLFDVLGNQYERCHGWPDPPGAFLGGVARLDDAVNPLGQPYLPYALRGGGFSSPGSYQRLGFRREVLPYHHPEEVYGNTGFRIARTVRSDNATASVTRAEVAETVAIRVEGSGAFAIKEQFGPVKVVPASGTLPATLRVATAMPPGWVPPEFSFVIDCPEMKERLWVGCERGRRDIRFVPQRVNSLGMAFSLLPAGEFVQGTPAEIVARIHGTERVKAEPLLGSESPPRRVRLTRALGMATTETTVAAFTRFTADAKYQTENEATPPKGSEYIDGAWRAITEVRNWRKPGNPTGDDFPVVYAAHPDAVRFCDWLTKTEKVGYWLPTEAQWEYAARGGSSSLWPGGDGPKGIEAYAWMGSNAKNPNPVGRKPPNRLGIHDTLGNVFEWCADRYEPGAYARGPATDPIEVRMGSVVRRGLDVTAEVVDLRPARRFADVPTSAGCLSGFRVACDPWEPKVSGQVVGVPEWEFRPALDAAPIPLAFTEPVNLPPFVLVPVKASAGSEWWAYPSVAVRSGSPRAFGWNTRTTWTTRYLDWRPPQTSVLPSPNVTEWTDALARPLLATERRPEMAIAGAGDVPAFLRPGPLGVACEGVVTLPAGTYEIVVSSSRGHRVWAESELIADAWDRGQPIVNPAELRWAGGRCRIRLEMFTHGEPAEVRLDLRPLAFGVTTAP